MNEEPKTTPMRVSIEAKRQAKIAAGFHGESAVQYVSRVVLEAAARDIAEFRRGGALPPVKPRSEKKQN